MKKNLTMMLTALLTTVAAYAAGDRCHMLEQGKRWWYVYHHFEAKEDVPDNASYRDFYDETTFPVAYTLDGYTEVNGRQYMKMYRQAFKGGLPGERTYYGAFREDAEGRVWQYDYEGNKQDFMLCDVTCTGYPVQEHNATVELIKADTRQLHRYRWNGFTAVEGVGFAGYGMLHYLLAPMPDCICDYEEFSHVSGASFHFTAQDFSLPKEIELTESERLLVQRNNDFAFRLFSELRGNGDLLLSPLGITCDMGMLNNGATGQTRQEIGQALGGDNADAWAINEFCMKMMTESGLLDGTTKVLLANTIFLNRDYTLKSTFLDNAHRYYNAQPETRNFSDGKTLDVINQWASDHTEGMIKEVLNEDTFSPEAVSYLLNALYFKGVWAKKFDVANTRNEPFNGGDEVPMMHLQELFGYAENDLYQAVVLPYGNGAYRMTVFLPREDKTIGDVLGRLSGRDWQPNAYESEVVLSMPRFETDTDVELNGTMEKLGMASAFNPYLANFSDFCTTPTYIGMMKQVARIKLDEQGTEAAAVTTIGDMTTAVPDHVVFNANRPFLYIVSEQSTGVIFFIGQYAGKEQASSIGSHHAGNTLRKQQPAIYNLSGQRLHSAPAHGLFISNGKKLVR